MEFSNVQKITNLFFLRYLAHLIATPQILVYVKSGTELLISKSFVNANKKGSKPEQPFSQEEINSIKRLLLSSVDQMEMDYNTGVLKVQPYQKYTTSFNMTLTSVEEAITFNNVHEGMHYGIIKMIMKFV